MSPSGSGWAHPCQLYSWPAGTTCAPQRGWGGRNKGLGPAGKGEEDYSLRPSSLNLPLYRRGIWGAQHLLKALAVSFIPLGHRPPTYLPIMRSTRAPSQISRDFLAPRSCLRLHFFSPGAAYGHMSMESPAGFHRHQQHSAGRQRHFGCHFA